MRKADLEGHQFNESDIVIGSFGSLWDSVMPTLVRLMLGPEGFMPGTSIVPTVYAGLLSSLGFRIWEKEKMVLVRKMAKAKEIEKDLQEAYERE